MKKIEPYKEQPERIPDEKIEIVFHQGKRLGRCFGEHTFDFSSGEPPSHFHCRSSSAGFYSDAVSKAEEKLARQMKKKMDDLLREVFLK